MNIPLSGSRSGRCIIVMGVSGAGKTSVSEQISVCLGGVFVEADDYHPQSNIALMSSGQALEDYHRWPWLKAVAEAALLEARLNQPYVIIACSALKRIYRDRLREMLGPVVFVHLTGSRSLIEKRMLARHSHFMPSVLLTSQFETLEPLERDEDGIVVSIEKPVKQIVESLCTRFSDACSD